MTSVRQWRKAAGGLPETEEGTHYSMPSFKVAGRGFTSLATDKESGAKIVQASLPAAEVSEVVERVRDAEPLVRNGTSTIGVSVPLDAIGGQQLNHLLWRAWLHKAPRALARRTEGSEGAETHTLPPAIGKPATRALLTAGVASLDAVAQHRAADLLGLHGVGPRAIKVLEAELSAHGLSFAD